MTHAYNGRTGVRYMTGGLKVYYVPWKPFLMQNTLPTFYGTLPIIRTILIREKISVVHGHQAFSTLCHEALMHARTMGYKVVFTDHSLYGFADVGSIHMNKVLQFTLADVSQAICVSHTSKENTVLRSGLPPAKVFVIPNAVDTSMFKPAPERLSNDEIVIVVVSRLVYRKGADLLVEVIPEVCRLHPNVSMRWFIWFLAHPCRKRISSLKCVEIFLCGSCLNQLQHSINSNMYHSLHPLHSITSTLICIFRPTFSLCFLKRNFLLNNLTINIPHDCQYM